MCKEATLLRWRHVSGAIPLADKKCTFGFNVDLASSAMPMLEYGDFIAHCCVRYAAGRNA